MKLNINFSFLQKLADNIGADISEWSLTAKELDPLELFKIELSRGVELNLDDVAVNDSGLLTLKEHQIILYIQDHSFSFDNTLADPRRNGRKFHVAECSTLKQMRNRNRFERYIATNDISGNFKIYGIDAIGLKKESIVRLSVCQNCLKKLNYKNFINEHFRQKQKIVETFDIQEFFSIYSSYFEEEPVNIKNNFYGYDDNWEIISSNYRKNKNWVCENCGVALSQYKNLLHTHHVNGVKHDNRDENLRALCIDCHSKQPAHKHIFVRRKTRQLINSLRKKTLFKSNNCDLNFENQWKEVFELADPATYGFLWLCKKKGYPVPQVGVDISHEGVNYAQAEIFWPRKKSAIVLKKDREYELMRKRGLNVYTLKDVMELWFEK